jgi:predicted NBD/HSP70 family sugar kinase
VKLATGYLNQAVVSATDNNPAAQSVVQETMQTLRASFDTITSWLLAGGLLLAVGAFLAGKPEWFRAAYAKIKQAYFWVRDQFQKRVHHTPPDAVGAAT